MNENIKAPTDEYSYLQWHKLWLRGELKKADKRQDKIKKELAGVEVGKVVGNALKRLGN